MVVPFPHVGPVKLVALQSQINLFHPSEQTPLLMHGCDSHWGDSLWHAGCIEPVAINYHIISDVDIILLLLLIVKFQLNVAYDIKRVIQNVFLYLNMK